MSADIWKSLKYAYDPTTWGDGLMSGKDLIDLSSSLYGYCNIESFYNKLAEFISNEGFTALLGRSVLGTLYDVPAHWVYVRNSTMNEFCRAYHGAKIFSVYTQFQI